MARIEGKDLIFWSVPLTIAGVAAVFAWRAFHQPEWVPSKDAPELAYVDACAVGRYRCRKDRVETTTGDRADGGGCGWRELAVCSRACVSERVALVGVDDQTAKTQLCNPPKRPLLLLSKDESFLDKPLSDAGSCEGDGYIPVDDGFVQCILRSGKDPAASGVVLGHAYCKAGTIKTLDRTPVLIKREEAAAVWCKRDPSADLDEPEVGVDAGVSDAEAGIDGGGDAVSDAASDVTSKDGS